MSIDIDIDRLVIDIKTAASAVISQDVTELRGFSERQVKALAKQAQMIATGIVKKEIDDDLQDFFLDSLEDMALNFVKTLRGLLMVTIEKVWNAVISVIWQAIESATGVKLGAPAAE